MGSTVLKYLFEFFSPRTYDHGYRAGFKKGVQEGQDWGHEHNACKHSHPFDGALSALGLKSVGHEPIAAKDPGI